MKENDVLDRWRNYFVKLLNEISCYYTDEVEKIEGPLQNITVDEVLRELKKIKNKKPLALQR